MRLFFALFAVMARYNASTAVVVRKLKTSLQRHSASCGCIVGTPELRTPRDKPKQGALNCTALLFVVTGNVQLLEQA